MISLGMCAATCVPRQLGKCDVALVLAIWTQEKVGVYTHQQLVLCLQPSPSPSLHRLRRQQHQDQQQAGPSSPHSVASTATTPRTPRPPPPTSADRSSAEFVVPESASRHATPSADRLQPRSVPATPEMAQLGGEAVPGGNGTPLQKGRAAWQSPPSVQQQMLTQDALSSPSPARLDRSPAPSSKLSGLPSAEDIDALCDMDKPSHNVEVAMPASDPSHVDKMCQSAHPALAPVLTRGSGAGHDDLAERPSGSGGPSTHPNDASNPQYSSSHFMPSMPRQHFPPNRSDVPESSARCCHSFRVQSECDSSAFDEGASSTLIHSISNEEQNMRDLLEDDNDDMFYNVMDTRQHDPEVDRHRTQQLNTMELHGILGEHGYKLPELAVDQEEEEDSDGDEGAGDEDLDDPDVDDDDEDEDTKAIFKVSGQPQLFVTHLVSKLSLHTMPSSQ